MTPLPNAARRADALLFPSPSVFSSPRLGPPPPCPTPGSRARARAQGPWPRRSALSPPLSSSSRRVPGGHASPTPAGRRAGAPGQGYSCGGGGKEFLGPEWRGGRGERGEPPPCLHPRARFPAALERAPSCRGKDTEQGSRSCGRNEVASGRASGPQGGREPAAPPPPPASVPRAARPGCNVRPTPRPPAFPVAPGCLLPPGCQSPPAKKVELLSSFSLERLRRQDQPW